jgi:hypothetical protein
MLVGVGPTGRELESHIPPAGVVDVERVGERAELLLEIDTLCGATAAPVPVW